MDGTDGAAAKSWKCGMARHLFGRGVQGRLGTKSCSFGGVEARAVHARLTRPTERHQASRHSKCPAAVRELIDPGADGR